jgi:hypothetical protein
MEVGKFSTTIPESNLQKLEELTQRLPLADFVAARKSNIVDYKVENGTCIGFGIFVSEDVAVQKAFASKGTLFPKHVHLETEYIIVVTGCMEAKGKKFGANSVCVFDPGEEHSAFFAEDTWMVCITIPPSDGYPNGR